MTVSAVPPRTKWLIEMEASPTAALRLFCLPYAGGGAAVYRPWRGLLPPDLTLSIVQLPGRETRLREPLVRRMEPLIAELVVAIAPLARHPFALFGHSMGALVAFELARALAQKGLPPACLFVSGRRAPQLPDPEPPLHQLADGPFVGAMVRRYNAIPQAILAETELLRLFLPTLRADFELLETYHYHAAALLPCPIVAFGGSDDPRAARAELAAWQHQTVGRFEMEQFPGDHFYLNSARSALLAAIVAKLQLADAPQSLAPGRLIPEF